MNYKFSIANIITFISSTLLLTQCATDECEGNQNTLPLAGFYSSEPSPKSISIDSLAIAGVGAPRDSVLWQSVSSGISEIYLPFKLDGGETSYEFRYLQKDLRGLSDRITFTYEACPFFVSAACGVSYRFHISDIEYTHNLIDSISVVGNVIDNTNIQNIRIYFRVKSGS